MKIKLIVELDITGVDEEELFMVTECVEGFLDPEQYGLGDDDRHPMFDGSGLEATISKVKVSRL